MEKQSNYKKLIILNLATLSGLGYFPLASGTVASFAGVVLFLFIKDSYIFLIVTLLVLVVSFLVAGNAERIFGRKDPRQVVIDDFAGQLLALLFIPRQAVYIFLSFLLFRLFDTFKIAPADILDKRRGSLGIVGDDVVAAVYANLSIQLIRLILKISS